MHVRQALLPNTAHPQCRFNKSNATSNSFLRPAPWLAINVPIVASKNLTYHTPSYLSELKQNEKRGGRGEASLASKEKEEGPSL